MVRFTSQVCAVFLKDWALQRRAWLSGLVKLSLPLLLLIILLAVQWLVDRELKAPEYQCGCQCIECCEWTTTGQSQAQGSYQCFNATSSRPCSPQADCKVFNDSNCGILYSSYTQVAFCPVPKPPVWPPLLQLPASVSPAGGVHANERLQLGQDSVAVTPLYTGRDQQLAARLTRAMLPNTTGVGARMIQAALASPRLSTAALGPGGTTQLDLCNLTSTQPGGLTSGSNAAALVKTLSGLLQGAAPGGNTSGILRGSDGLDGVMTPEGIAQLTADFSEVLANLSLVLGTSADTGASLLLEPAFVAGTEAFGAGGAAASSSGGAGSLGPPGGGYASGTSLDSKQVQPLYLMADCNELIATGGVDLAALRQLSCGLRLALGVPVLCAALQPAWEPGVSAIDERVYCSWRGSSCSACTASPTTSPETEHLLSHDANEATNPSAHRLLLHTFNATASGSLGQPVDVTAMALGWHTTPSRTLLAPVGTQPDASSGPSTPAAASAGTPAAASTGTPAAASTGTPAAASTGTPAAASTGPQQSYPSVLVDWGGSTLTAARGGGSPHKPVLDLSMWFNSTNFQASISPDIQRWPAAINLASNAYVSASWEEEHQAHNASQTASAPQLHLEGVKGFPSAGGPLSLDLATLLGPLFIMWVLQLPLPMMVAAMSGECVGGQRALMLRQGLTYSTAAVATYLWWLLWCAVFTTVFVVFGWGAGLNFFTTTAPGIQIALYLVWFHAMYALAWWLSVFYQETQNAVLASIALLIFSGMVANLVVVQFVESGPQWLAILLEALAPPFALFRALWEVSQYAFLADTSGRSGLTADKLHDPGNGFILALVILSAHTIIGLWSAFYWEHVFVESKLGGRRLHPFFPLGFKLKPEDPRGWAWFIAQAHTTQSRIQQLWTRPDSTNTSLSGSTPGSNSTASPVKHTSPQAAGTQGGQLVAAAPSLVPPASPPAAAADGQPAVEAVVHVVVDTPASPIRQVMPAPALEPASPTAAVAVAVATHNQPVLTRVLTRVSEESHSYATHSSKHSEISGAGVTSHSTPGHIIGQGQDVEAERQRVVAAWQLLGNRVDPVAPRGGVPSITGSTGPQREAGSDGACDGTPAVLVRGVQRVFKSYKAEAAGKPAVTELVAVKDLWLCIDKGECFGLLGPNGAGKTTTLRIMQGLLEPTGGSVLLCGHDIAREPRVSASKAGICPQHDVLWPSLSAEEHLHCYGRLRGLRGSDLRAAVHQQLVLLDLTDAHKASSTNNSKASTLAARPCSSFSGGMRRRLSVGCALLGQPAVVFLDEPSAGLDPASRAALWQAIRAARVGSDTAIVMTTHSMREAECLCDRLGVFVAGQLQCIGSAQELTRRYADSLLLNMVCVPSKASDLQALVTTLVCPDASLVSSAGGANQWQLPKHKVDLASLFASVQTLADTHGGLHVSDWSIHSASLDQVFNAIVAAQRPPDACEP